MYICRYSTRSEERLVRTSVGAFQHGALDLEDGTDGTEFLSLLLYPYRYSVVYRYPVECKTFIQAVYICFSVSVCSYWCVRLAFLPLRVPQRAV